MMTSGMPQILVLFTVFALKGTITRLHERICVILLSSGVYVYIFFKVILKLYVDAGRFVGRCTKRLGTKAAFSSKPVCI